MWLSICKIATNIINDSKCFPSTSPIWSLSTQFPFSTDDINLFGRRGLESLSIRPPSPPLRQRLTETYQYNIVYLINLHKENGKQSDCWGSWYEKAKRKKRNNFERYREHESYSEEDRELHHNKIWYLKIHGKF